MIIINQEKKKKKFTVYDMTPLPDYTFKNRPISPYGWDDCGFKYQEKLKNPPADGEYLFEPYEHSKYEKKDEGHEAQEIAVQAYLTDRNENDAPKDFQMENAYTYMAKRASKQANYIMTDHNTIELKQSLAYPVNNEFQGDQAAGHYSVSNDSIKPTITVDDAKVRVTDIGTNPYTNERVRIPSRKIDEEVCTVDGVDGEPALKHNKKFWSQFESTKVNFIGHVHKKSCGRGPTGYLSPDPKETRKWAHDVMVQLIPNVIARPTQKQVKFRQLGALQMSKEVTQITRSKDCECGCNIKLKDLRRGEIVCPKCGIVFGRSVGDYV